MLKKFHQFNLFDAHQNFLSIWSESTVSLPVHAYLVCVSTNVIVESADGHKGCADLAVPMLHIPNKGIQYYS